MKEEDKYSELCYGCGTIVFPNRKVEEERAITMYMGICPKCKKERALIPIADWKNLWWD